MDSHSLIKLCLLAKCAFPLDPLNDSRKRVNCALGPGVGVGYSYGFSCSFCFVLLCKLRVVWVRRVLGTVPSRLSHHLTWLL